MRDNQLDEAAQPDDDDARISHQTRRVMSEHLSREASRHSHAPAAKTVGETMAVYARQMHLRLIWSQEELAAASPGALMTVVRGGFPRFTGPQRRRLTKRINRMKGHQP
jgi:hypothetical protein